MQKLRETIKSHPYLWLACLLPALLYVLSMQLHIHVHADHQHEAGFQQHSHETNMHNAHLGNTHDAEHSSNLHHAEAEIYSIDVSPDGLSKLFSSGLFAVALFSVLVLFVAIQSQCLVLKRFTERTPYICKRAEQPPQLRAPPL